MVNRKRLLKRRGKALGNVPMEVLEDRCLLSANHPGFGGGGMGGGGGRGGPQGDGHGGAGGVAITFSELSTAIQNGLDTLATTDGVTAPTSTTNVQLGNVNGVETYTVDITGTGTDTRLTVDASGNPVTPATHSTTTFGEITNTAVTDELTSIASALNLTAPASTTTVNVTTASDGTSTYSLSLSAASTTTASSNAKKKAKKNASTSSSVSSAHGSTTITVDSNGNPVGNESVPLSVLSTAIQSGLTSNAPSGATALATTALVKVQTINGVTFYTATYTGTGTTSTVTVDTTGTLASLPSSSTTTFSAIPSAAQTAIQTLATANGVTTTVDSSQSVTAYNEGNGTTIYSVRLTATGTSASGSTYTFPLTITVDADGNPTVAPLAMSSMAGMC